MAADATGGGRNLRARIGLWTGPLLALLILLIGPPAALAGYTPGETGAQAAWMVLALLVLMAVWWVSEAVPIPVTSLLPLIVLPLATDLTLRQAAAFYMDSIVVLLMGGLIVAKVIERWNLHARIALGIVSRVGSRPSVILAGFMAACALLSMWISNSATAIMMTPIALSVAAAVAGTREGEGAAAGSFTVALLLAIAWSCSIGGLGTPVGTPTNLIVINGLVAQTGRSISFPQWMMIGVPVVLVMLPAAWFVLTRWAFKFPQADGAAGQAVARRHLLALGPVTAPEVRTMALFALVAGLWIVREPLNGLEIAGTRPFEGLQDGMIAILGVVLAFLIPSGLRDGPRTPLLDWETAERIPWGVILLFGGGLSLANAINVTGLGLWIGSSLSPIAGLPLVLVLLAIVAAVLFLTEVTSNVATASALMPVLGALAMTGDLPLDQMAAALAMAASCAFMLPMATGPNAVIFASGRVSLPQMALAGIRLNFLAIVIITGLVTLTVPYALGG